MPATHDAQILVTRAGQTTIVRLFDYLTPGMAEDAERRANEWIKSLRHAAVDDRTFRDALSYRADSLWWFAELYLHKRRTINGALSAMRALEALIERERPAALAVAAGDRIVRVLAPQVASRHGVPMSPDAAATGRGPWVSRAARSVVPRIYALSPLLRRLRALASRRPAGAASGVDVVVFVHSAFWRAETGDDTYVGPLVDVLRSEFGPRLEIISLGPPTAFRSRTWSSRVAELWTQVPKASGPEAPDLPRSIEVFSSVGALSGSRQLWRDRRDIADRLLSSEGLRRASVVQGIDLWPVLEDDFAGIATLQVPWSARAMDEAAAALDVLRPRVIVTYAEAGGWGRALVLEARRRGISSVGVQHGFISRHWLNYLHEPDEIERFPFPTRTLLYDEFAREHLLRRGHFPPAGLAVVGNPRLDALAKAASMLAPGELEHVRTATGARPDQALVLLAAKRIPEFDETFSELFRAIAGLPSVHLAVRPHPAETPEPYERLVRGAPNIRVVPLSLSPVALIAASRLVATINSTVAIEATVLGIPALAMRLPNYLSPFVDAGAMAGTSTLAEIGPLVRRLVEDGPERTALVENAAQFLEHYRMMPDGHAAERTVEIVRALSEATS